MAKNYGLDFSHQDLLDYTQSLTQKNVEPLSEEFLSQVSGGTGCGYVIWGLNKSTGSGYGSCSGGGCDKGCGCFSVGVGMRAGKSCVCIGLGALT